MTRTLSDGRIIAIMQSKTDPAIKTGFIYDKKSAAWCTAYTGDLAGVKKWLSHQVALANKRESRSMIADMCGTSFSAAMADMGISKF